MFLVEIIPGDAPYVEVPALQDGSALLKVIGYPTLRFIWMDMRIKSIGEDGHGFDPIVIA
jgi:hypothetical protein